MKNGQGSIFKNDHKTKDTHPEYRGKIKTPSGEEFEISLWVKEGAKGKFFSASIQPPYVADGETTKPQSNEEPNDDLPF